jgi:hypothetical protein
MAQAISSRRSSGRRARRVPQQIRPAVVRPPRVVTRHTATPLVASVYQWLLDYLQPAGYQRPFCTRLAVLVSGLLVGPSASVADLAETVRSLAITPAREPSIVRRLQRIEADGRLDPATVLPPLFRALLPTLLQAASTAHAANMPTGPSHHGRFVALRLVIDATTKADQVHILTAGLAYQGIVLPLAVRTWEQNVAQTEGDEVAQVLSVLGEIYADLPADLRDHVLLLADRWFGNPRLLDLRSAYGWHWVLRVQHQTKVRIRSGQERTLRELAPTPGSLWCAEADAHETPDQPIAAFKQAGWRPCQVVALWLPGEPEPWLLLTDLPDTVERLRDYAQRWAIERLFLSWKSHGLDLEQVGLRDPQRLGHLLTGLVVATLWRLAAAGPRTSALLQTLALHAPREGTQLRLRLWPTSLRLPWPGKFSLFTWGTKIFRQTTPKTHTPPLCWTFSGWDAPPWSQRCHDAYHGIA